MFTLVTGQSKNFRLDPYDVKIQTESTKIEADSSNMEDKRTPFNKGGIGSSPKVPNGKIPVEETSKPTLPPISTGENVGDLPGIDNIPEDYLKKISISGGTLVEWTSNGTTKKFQHFAQSDPLWKSVKMFSGGVTDTILGGGCGPTSMAMVLTTLTGKYINPVASSYFWSRNNWFAGSKYGLAGYHTSPGNHAKAYGFSSDKLSGSGSSMIDTLKTKLNGVSTVAVASGNGAVPFTNGGHFIVIADYDKDSDEFIVLNSASVKYNKAMRYSTSHMKSQRISSVTIISK